MRRAAHFISKSSLKLALLSAALLSSTSVYAQNAAADDAQEVGKLEEIVVTGTTARNRTVLESSVAITAVDAEGLARKAPRSTASALQLVPGIFVEDSGGEVSNNFSVRGLAGGAQTFIQISEDGLPVFYTNALSDTILKQELSIDRLEAVRGGTSGILTVNGAGATINFITRKPTATPTGIVRLTGSDFNTKRIDVFYGGPIAEDLFFSVSGFYRSSDSVRDTGFTADHGGLARFRLLRTFEGGEFGISLKVVDDHNTFLLPIPLANPNDPEGIPGLSATKGTLVSLDSGVQTVRTSPASGRAFQTNDVTDGVATKAFALGFHYDQELGSGITLRAKGRYTDFKNDFNAVFNFDNNTLVPATARLDPTRFSEIGLLLNRFAPQGAVRAGLRVVGTGEVISTPSALNALNGNGLTADGITANNQRDVKEFVGDISVSYETDRNLFSVGALFFDTKVNDGNIGASTFISDVSNSPRRLDIVALNSANQVVGFLTENGLLNYGSFGEGVSRSKQESLSFYANNEFKVTDRLRIDAGVRLEFFNIDRLEGISAGPLRVAGAFDANGNDVDNIIANNFIAQFGGGAFTGNFRTQKGDFEEVAYTLGGSYRILDNLAAYGRFARGFQANGQNPVTDIEFAELGLRYQDRTLAASITAFTTRFIDFRFSRQLPGAVLPTEFNGDIKVLGAEFDLTWRPLSFLQLQALGVIQNSRLDIKNDQGTGFARSFDGNQPERTPETNISFTPSFFLPNDLGEIYLTVSFLGKRFSDLANSLELPSYTTLDAGISLNLGKRFTLALSGQNLTNTIGLTEGNPRSGFTENPGVSNFFYARPILGRNFVANLTYTF